MAYDDSTYEEYKRQCEVRRKENEGFLSGFERALRAEGLSEKTIRRHIDNVDFYINTYLLREEAYPAAEGCYRADDFLGYFFIRKCMWSTPNTIKQNITSFKKFYKHMLQLGHISQEDYDTLVATIKEYKQDWLEECERFNSPDESWFSAEAEASMFSGIYNAVARELGLSELLGIAGPDEGEPLTREEAIESMTLALFYLTSWDEKNPLDGDNPIHKAWKSADWNALDTLREAGFIQCTNKAKSVVITKRGMDHAEECIAAFGLDYLL